jgi:uncharacterized protein YeeX (DUF496 family)
MVEIGSIWLRIGTGGGLMWKRWWTSGFHKMLGSSRVVAQLAASQEGLSSMSEWVNPTTFDVLIWVANCKVKLTTKVDIQANIQNLRDDFKQRRNILLTVNFRHYFDGHLGCDTTEDIINWQLKSEDNHKSCASKIMEVDRTNSKKYML